MCAAKKKGLLGRLADGLRGQASLDPDELIDEARTRAELEDVGAPLFREPLERLVSAAEEDGLLHARGRGAHRETLIASVVARLRWVDGLKRAPSARDEPPRRPLIIAGLPRTGTTLLHRLLCQDKHALYLPLWVGLDPYPPADDEEWKDDGPLSERRERARAIVEGVRQRDPALASLHAIDADAPEECSQLFRSTLDSWQFFITTPLPSYMRWYAQHDATDAYREFRLALQLLQSQRRAGHWVLKAPQHWDRLGELLDVFPDADVICTHRDPAQVVGSWCSLLSHLWGATSGGVDPALLGRAQLEMLAGATRRAVRAHDAANGRVIDVNFQDLVRDPIAAVRSIYERTGRALDEASEARMRASLASNPRGKQHAHRYALADYGLAGDEVAEAFADYREGLLARVSQPA